MSTQQNAADDFFPAWMTAIFDAAPTTTAGHIANMDAADVAAIRAERRVEGGRS